MDTLDQIINEIQEMTGADLNGYRREVVRRHIEVCMIRVGTDSMDKYLQILRQESDESRHLLESFSINVSSFFRDPGVFEIISSEILPSLVTATPSFPLRIWSAGCASGEEPYSLAILINEFNEGREIATPSMIFATDIDQGTLELATKAKYNRNTLENTKLGYVDKYFSWEKDHFTLGSGVKEMVHFSCEDLLESDRHSPQESIFGEFDLILCRNVMIYFNETEQQQLLRRFCQALTPGGFLILGLSENLHGPAKEYLKSFDKKNQIYRKFKK